MIIIGTETIKVRNRFKDYGFKICLVFAFVMGIILTSFTVMTQELSTGVSNNRSLDRAAISISKALSRLSLSSSLVEEGGYLIADNTVLTESYKTEHLMFIIFPRALAIKYKYFSLTIDSVALSSGFAEVCFYFYENECFFHKFVERRASYLRPDLYDWNNIYRNIIGDYCPCLQNQLLLSGTVEYHIKGPDRNTPVMMGVDHFKHNLMVNLWTMGSDITISPVRSSTKIQSKNPRYDQL